MSASPNLSAKPMMTPSASSESLSALSQTVAPSLKQINKHSTNQPVSQSNIPARWSSLVQSILTRLNEPTINQSINPINLFYWVVAANIDQLMFDLNNQSSEIDCLDSIVRLVDCLPTHQRSILQLHVHCLIDRLIAQSLCNTGYLSTQSIAHIDEDDEDDDQLVINQSIKGISGGSTFIFNDELSARMFTLRHAIEVLHRRFKSNHPSDQSNNQPILLVPDLPNVFKRLDPLLFYLNLSRENVRLIPIVQWDDHSSDLVNDHSTERSEKRTVDSTQERADEQQEHPNKHAVVDDIHEPALGGLSSDIPQSYVQSSTSPSGNHSTNQPVQTSVKESLHATKQPLDPLRVHRTDTVKLHEILLSLSHTHNQSPLIFLTTLGNSFTGPGEILFYEDLNRIQAVKQSLVQSGQAQNLWIHCEGESLFIEGAINHLINQSNNPETAQPNDRRSSKPDSQTSRHSTKQLVNQSLLYLLSDSIIFNLSQSIESTYSPLSVAAFKQSPRSLNPSVNFALSVDSFSDLFTAWYTLSSCSVDQFNNHSNAYSLIREVALNRSHRLMEFKDALVSQSINVSLMAPDNQPVNQILIQSTHQMISVPSHPYLFIQLTLPEPYHPSMFNLSNQAINQLIAHRLALRAAGTDADAQLLGEMFGVELAAANLTIDNSFYQSAQDAKHSNGRGVTQSINQAGFLCKPHAFSQTDWRFLIDAIKQEIDCLSECLIARKHLEAIIQSDPEFEWIEHDQLLPINQAITLSNKRSRKASASEPALDEQFDNLAIHQSNSASNNQLPRVGLGAFRFVPSTVPDHFIDQVSINLSTKLQSIYQSTPWPTSAIPEIPPQLWQSINQSNSQSNGHSVSQNNNQMLDSIFHAGYTVDGRACTIIDVNPFLIQRLQSIDQPAGQSSNPANTQSPNITNSQFPGLQSLWADIRSIAVHLNLPKKVDQSINQSVIHGIREAEKRINQSINQQYSLPNIISRIPVVGTVLHSINQTIGLRNTQSSQQTNNQSSELAVPVGQSYDLKKKELNVIRYSYNQGNNLPPQHQSMHQSTHLATNPATLTPQLINSFPLINTVSAPVSVGNSAHYSHTRTNFLSSTPTNHSSNRSVSHSVTQSTDSPSVGTRSVSMNQSANQSVAGDNSGDQTVKRPPPLSTNHSTNQTSTRHKSTKRTIAVNIDEQDRNILRRAPPISDVIDLLTKGVKFTAYFLNEPSADQSNDGSNQTKSSDEQISLSSNAQFTTADLILFYAPQFPMNRSTSHPNLQSANNQSDSQASNQPNTHSTNQPTDQFNDLGRGPVLAWCEPNVNRYFDIDQAIAIDQIVEIYVGNKNHHRSNIQSNNPSPKIAFPVDLQSESCIAIITPQISLCLKAENKLYRDDFFRALYGLLASQPSVTPRGGRRVLSKNASGGTTPSSATPRQLSRSASSSNQSSSQSSPRQLLSSSPSNSQSIESINQAVANARSLLTKGQPFAVHVIAKEDNESSTRHEVTLWLRDAIGDQSTSQSNQLIGYLCWCKRGVPLEYTPSRSLPITQHVQICLGKQTKAFKQSTKPSTSQSVHQVDEKRCFSIMVDKMILNLEAPSMEVRDEWLQAFHTFMLHSGKKHVLKE